MKVKILVVDDEKPIYEALSGMLESDNFQFFWAQNSEEFRKIAFSENLNLIMLDVMLGNEDGPEVYKQLLTEGLSRDIPLIYMTGLAEGENPAPLHDGRNCTLHGKPFQFDKLLRDINYLTHHN